jgi:hypothetical protein
MRHWSYDRPREPKVTVSAVAGSRTGQVLEAAMNFLIAHVETVLASLRIAGFARVDEIWCALLQVACAASRASHDARVD